MNKEDPYRDQAERLRQRIEKVQEDNLENVSGSSLPPRSDLHRQRHNHKKTKWKLKYPVIRLLVLFFILLPIVSFSVYSYFDGMKHGGAKKTSVDSRGYETINFEKAKKETQKKSAEDELKQQVNTENESTIDSKSSQPKQNELPLENSGLDADSLNSAGSDKNNGNIKESQASSQTNTSANSNANTNTNANTNPNTNVVTATKKIVYHTVQPHETIYRIAINYYHSKNGVAIIKEANHMKSDTIEQGQVLKIPLDQ